MKLTTYAVAYFIGLVVLADMSHFCANTAASYYKSSPLAQNRSFKIIVFQSAFAVYSFVYLIYQMHTTPTYHGRLTLNDITDFFVFIFLAFYSTLLFDGDINFIIYVVLSSGLGISVSFLMLTIAQNLEFCWTIIRKLTRSLKSLWRKVFFLSPDTNRDAMLDNEINQENNDNANNRKVLVLFVALILLVYVFCTNFIIAIIIQ